MSEVRRTGIHKAIMGMRVGKIERDRENPLPDGPVYYNIFSDMGTFMFCVNGEEIFDEEGNFFADDTE